MKKVKDILDIISSELLEEQYYMKFVIASMYLFENSTKVTYVGHAFRDCVRENEYFRYKDLELEIENSYDLPKKKVLME